MPIRTSKNTHPDTTEWISATICFINLEGGFFSLLCSDNRRLLPLNLTSEYAQDGAKVKIKGHENHDTMTIQQWGTPFTITDIELLERGNAPINRLS